MANVEIRNAEVTRLISGYGAVVCESYKDKQGEIRKNYYTVWTNDSLAEGDVLNVKGLLSVKLDSYDKNGEKQYKAVANINNPTIEKVDVEF